MAKRVLMIAFHYPPYLGGSGLQRTLSFSRYLPVYGWTPIVLTAHPRAYPGVRNDQLDDIPATLLVKRALAFDTARHFAFRGRYLRSMALPDRWVSWFLGAIPAGLRLIRQYRPQVLWSTYPIATAHLIGCTLSRLTGLPWFADFRDPMTEIDPVSKQRWPADPSVWRARQWIERLTMQYCTCSVFVAPGALRMYAERYPEIPERCRVLIANGYDEEIFTAAEQLAVYQPAQEQCLCLLHSGTLYPTPDRDPTAFFIALAKLQSIGKISPLNLRVVLRASGYDEHYRQLIQAHGITDMVALEPPLPYRDALAEMIRAHGLLLFQGHDSNPTIPAKFYEYLRAKRPIFAMVDAEGETARALRTVRIGKIVPLDSSEAILQGFLEFLDQLRVGNAPIAPTAEIHRHSRESRTQELVKLLDAVA